MWSLTIANETVILLMSVRYAFGMKIMSVHIIVVWLIQFKTIELFCIFKTIEHHIHQCCEWRERIIWTNKPKPITSPWSTTHATNNESVFDAASGRPIISIKIGDIVIHPNDYQPISFPTDEDRKSSLIIILHFKSVYSYVGYVE